MQTISRMMSFAPKGIGQLLAEDRLIVPLNQRHYAWEDDQVEDLIHDFSEALDSDSGLHFLGFILLTSGESEHPEINDGQQRLATTTMVLAGFRDYLLSMGRDDDAGSIERDFLFKWDRSEGENLPRIRLNADDHVFFEDTVLKRPKNRPKRKDKKLIKDSHKNIEKASHTIREYITKRLSPEKDEQKVKVINSWIKFIEKNAIVVAINVLADLDAYVTFETLNDRGLETSQADLLKNYLFSKVKDRMDEAQQKWSSMVGKLESLGHKGITVSFVRHLLITMYGHTKERDVLKKVKGQIGKPSKAIAFLDSMEDGSDDYVAMLNPAHSKWNKYGDEARDHLWTIHLDLEVRQVWPLLFAVIRHFTVAQAKLAFKYLVNLSVRFLIVGGRGGLLDRNYAIAAHQIGTNKITTAKQLANSLGSIAPKDQVFEVEFASARVSNSSLARYYLRAIENYQSKLPSPEVMPIEDRNKLNLEHILPENPGANWPDFSEEDAKAYCRRIGNLVLMLSTKNALVGNQDFATKKPHLLASSLALTKAAGKPQKWTKETIASRQKDLAKLAVKTWPLDFS